MFCGGFVNPSDMFWNPETVVDCGRVVNGTVVMEIGVDCGTVGIVGTGVDCIVETGVDCIVETGVDCIVETGVDCGTEVDCIVETDVDCGTGVDCIVGTGVDCIVETDVDCIVGTGVVSGCIETGGGEVGLKILVILFNTLEAVEEDPVNWPNRSWGFNIM
jgi:hypothetical protein